MVDVSVSIEVGGRDLLTSGSVMVHARENLFFRVADLTMVFEFEATEDKKISVIQTGETEKGTVITLQNFDNALGSTWWADIGIVDSRKLRIGLFIHTIGRDDRQIRLVNYTLSLGERIDGQ